MNNATGVWAGGSGRHRSTNQDTLLQQQTPAP
jgi:hypothetical protein